MTSPKLFFVVCIIIIIYRGDCASIGLDGGADATAGLAAGEEVHGWRFHENFSTKSSDRGRVGGMGGIVGGTDADKGEYPWQVLLVRIYGNKQSPFCGGTIIDDHHIITAAHCIVLSSKDEPINRYPHLYRAVVGDYNWKINDATEQYLNIADIALHDWSKATNVNDIAIIRSVEKIQFGKFVQPARLPWNSNIQKLYKPGTKALISGWGSTKQKKPLGPVGQMTPILQEAEVIVRDSQKCGKSILQDLIEWCKSHRDFSIGHQDDRLKKEMVICGEIMPFVDFGFDPPIAPMVKKNMFCAGYYSGGIGACQGDSGGPIGVKDEEGRFVLTGIASASRGCAWKGLPAIYTNVLNYRKWIEKYLNSA